MGSSSIYTTGLSAKTALLEETLAVLRQISQGDAITEVKERVIADDLLGKDTVSTRESVWKRIHARYLSDDEYARTLARMVVHAPDLQTQKLVLFYEFASSNPLLWDVVIECVYPRYAGGYALLDKSIIQQYLDEATEAHPEIAGWSPQTRAKIVSNILTILRDFGLLEGTQQKHFTRVYVPLPAFVYVLYRLVDEGVTTPTGIIQAPQWRLFFLDEEDVVTLLDEASATGHCNFKHQGDIYTLILTYPSLEVCVAALTGQV
jgi:hypothetical protein